LAQDINDSSAWDSALFLLIVLEVSAGGTLCSLLHLQAASHGKVA